MASSDLQLTYRQRIGIDLIYQNMSNKAKRTGAEIMAIEDDIDRVFANKSITEEKLKLVVDNCAGGLYGQIRFVHLYLPI
jgi:hypothetical protein